MRRVRVRLHQRIELIIQRDHAFLRADGIDAVAALPQRVDAPRAFPRLFFGQITAHERIHILLKAREVALAADEIRHLQNNLFDVGIVKQKHRRAETVGQRNDRLRQFAEIRRLDHQPRNALIHQRLKRMRHQLCIAARIRQRCHNQIAAVKVRSCTRWDRYSTARLPSPCVPTRPDRQSDVSDEYFEAETAP